MQTVPAYAGVVATDLACYKNMISAEALEGVAKREALLKLVNLGCAVVIDDPLEVVSREDVPKSPDAVHVRLLRQNWPKEDMKAEWYVRSSDIFDQLMMVSRPVKR